MDVPVDAGFLCTKPAMLNAVTKARPCRKNHDQYPFFHPQCKGRLFPRAITATLILNFRTRWRGIVSHSGHFTPRGRTLSTLVGWVDPSTGLDVMEQRKIPCSNKGLSSSNYKTIFT